jgi:hypothetical protein
MTDSDNLGTTIDLSEKINLLEEVYIFRNRLKEHGINCHDIKFDENMTEKELRFVHGLLSYRFDRHINK